jgi:hypothetical protein
MCISLLALLVLKKAQILTLRKLQAPRLLRPYLGESEAAVREVA